MHFNWLAFGAAFVFGALVAKGFAQSAPKEKAQGAAVDLGAFWPAQAPQRRWTLVSRADRSATRRSLMSVANENVGPEQFILWFSGKEGQPAGKRDGERYRLCLSRLRTWLFLDGYIDAYPDRPKIEHPVRADRIIFKPAGGTQTDLIKNGEYADCGAQGQPYLVWFSEGTAYRIQVWGHLVENPQLKWYWDATVSGPEKIVNECLKPTLETEAVKVQEAWWSNFRGPGKWGLGSGELTEEEDVPTGGDVVYGRTVWHGAGQVPYLVTGDAAGNPRWCVANGPTVLPEGLRPSPP